MTGTSRTLVVLFGSVLWLTAACSGPVVPLSVQAGASVVIPLTGDRMVMPTIGFGSELIDDPQRGALVFRLRETGTELTTRATSPLRLGYSPDPSQDGRVQIVSLVDVPPDAPSGTYSIEVLRRFRDAAGFAREEEIPYDGVLSILPHELDLDCDQTVDQVGQPTPWALIAGGFVDDVSYFASVGLKQRLELVLDLSASVRAAEIELSFPADVIRIEEAAPIAGRTAVEALSWRNESSPGRVSIGLIGQTDFETVAVAFTLVDGEQQILDPSTVQAIVLSSVDEDGFELGRTVQVAKIR